MYITGSFSDIADLDPGPASATRTATATDAFFIRLNDDGTLNWLKTAGNGNYAQGLGVAVDFTSTPVFTGNYSGALDIDLGPPVVTLDDHSGFDIFIVKLENSNGAYRWGGGFGADGGGNYVRSISIDGQTTSTSPEDILDLATLTQRLPNSICPPPVKQMHLSQSSILPVHCFGRAPLAATWVRIMRTRCTPDRQACTSLARSFKRQTSIHRRVL